MERIKTSALQAGMCVDLGKGWLKHPFLRRVLVLNNRNKINKIYKYIDFVSCCR